MNGIAQIDWSLLHAFLSVAEAGSLSAAARRTGISQPTLGRHIRRLEDVTGAALFTRHRGGLALSEAGQALLPAVQDMAQAAARAALAAEGRAEDGLAGTVRIATSMVFAHFHMPGILARLRHRAPGIAVELAPSDLSENLLFREADIAIRLYRPDQLDMATRKLGDMTIGAYAARDYLDRRGVPPGLPGQSPGHDWVGLDRNDLILRVLRAEGIAATRADFTLRCDDQAAAVHLIRAGCGAGFVQDAVAARFPELVRILPDAPIPLLPVWLTVPEALRRVPRIRFVLDFLADEVTALTAARRPPPPVP